MGVTALIPPLTLREPPSTSGAREPDRFAEAAGASTEAASAAGRAIYGFLWVSRDLAGISSQIRQSIALEHIKHQG